VASIDVAKYRLAMAGTGPDSAGSQFFIILGEGSGPIIQNLRGKHTVFAEVIEGQEIIDSLNEISVDDPESNSPRPLQDIIVEDIEIFTK
jgi:cyclophilin family peptidyl-prolyl cis-trans isomerase